MHMPARRRIAPLTAVCLALAAAPAAGRADQPRDAADSKLTNGAALAERAYELHQAGRFSESVATYLQAYELTGSSPILFNIALIYDRKLRELDLAAEYYRRYLRSPDASPDLVHKANDRLDALRQQASLPRPAPAAPTPAPAAPTPAPAAPTPAPAAPTPAAGGDSSSEWRTFGFVLGSFGMASLGLSAAFAVRAKSKDDQADKFCQEQACTDRRGPALAEDAATAANVATVTLVGGLVGASGGALLYFMPPGRRAATSTGALRFAPSVGYQGGGLSLTGTW
jgi:tetratricopeptide (TPR) repeat protein